MRQFKGVVKGRSGPVIYVVSPGSPTAIGGHVEAIVPRGPLRSLIRATVLDHQESRLSMWVTSCELTGFQTREARYKTPGQGCTVKYGKSHVDAELIDISMHGAGIEAREDLEVGDLVVVELEADRRPVKSSFRVAWSERPVGQRHTRYGLRLNEEIRLSASDWKGFVQGQMRRAA
ncbi:MAG: PilZ domain-containing protein [Armatimonadota bacterium]